MSSALETAAFAYIKTAHAYQVYASAQCVYNSYIAIINLQKHEDTSEKAAQYSKTAADQLTKIRLTQGSGAISSVISFCSALYLLVYGSSSQSSRIAASCFNLVALLGARQYMRNFWSGSANVPFLKSYNQALQKTEWLTTSMMSAALGWIATVIPGLG